MVDRNEAIKLLKQGHKKSLGFYSKPSVPNVPSDMPNVLGGLRDHAKCMSTLRTQVYTLRTQLPPISQ